MSDELRKTIVNLTTDIRQTVADACAAMNHAAAQLRAADTQPPPDMFALILARLDALEQRVAEMTEPEIDYESLADNIDLSDLADYIDCGEVASNIDASDIADSVDLDDLIETKVCGVIETKVRDVLRSI